MMTSLPSAKSCVCFTFVFCISCIIFAMLYSQRSNTDLLQTPYHSLAHNQFLVKESHDEKNSNSISSQAAAASTTSLGKRKSILESLTDLYSQEKELLGHQQPFSEWLTQLLAKVNSTISRKQSQSAVKPVAATQKPKQNVPAMTKPENSIGSNNPLVVLFSTWVDNPEKRQVQENVLRTWRLWKPLVTPLLFSNDQKVKIHAAKFGWKILPDPKTACSGVPVYREMFRIVMKTFPTSTFYGFVNGDLLLSNGIVATMEAVAEWASRRRKPVMMLLRRINVDFKNRPPLSHVDDLEAIATEGKPMIDGSTDGIFTNRFFPWDHVPDIVPGRLGVAMWMVSYGREMGADVIDISETTIGVHMTATKAGNREGWTHKNPRCNHHIYERLKIKPQSWFCGFIRCAAFKTNMTNEGGINKVKVIDKRATNHKRCGECHMDLRPLKSTVF